MFRDEAASKVQQQRTDVTARDYWVETVAKEGQEAKQKQERIVACNGECR